MWHNVYLALSCLLGHGILFPIAILKLHSNYIFNTKSIPHWHKQSKLIWTGLIWPPHSIASILDVKKVAQLRKCQGKHSMFESASKNNTEGTNLIMWIRRIRRGGLNDAVVYSNLLLMYCMQLVSVEYWNSRIHTLQYVFV